MEFTAIQVAAFLKGTVEGDPEVRVSNLSKIEEGMPGTMSFLANPVYTPHLYTTRASIVVVNNDFVPEKPVPCTLVRVENAYAAFAMLMEMFAGRQKNRGGISSLAFIAESAKIGKDVYIGEFVFIGENVVIGDGVSIYPQGFLGENVVVGSGTTLYPGVKLYHDTIVGNNCTLHSGVIAGSDGFGFAPLDSNDYRKIPQLGNVIIEDDVEIGSNTTIDRATLGSTIIRKGVKLDNLIQVAHNVEIGENTVIAAQSGISGSTKVGRNCMIGGQVGIVGHITIADNVKIGAQSGIGHSITREGETVLGSPAIPLSLAKRVLYHFHHLDDMAKKLRELEKKIVK